jgi:hypothetical protein
MTKWPVGLFIPEKRVSAPALLLDKLNKKAVIDFQIE